MATFEVEFPADLADAADNKTDFFLMAAFQTEGFMPDTIKHKDLTDRILKAFYKVYNALGYGFLEKVYENAMLLELSDAGLKVARQQPIKVYYQGRLVGDYFADLVIENKVIIELKVAEAICGAHIAQLRNYLRATEIEVGLLLNFGTAPQFTRKFFSNESKQLKGEPHPS